jgi:hypothetical protein
MFGAGEIDLDLYFKSGAVHRGYLFEICGVDQPSVYSGFVDIGSARRFIFIGAQLAL